MNKAAVAFGLPLSMGARVPSKQLSRSEFWHFKTSFSLYTKILKVCLGEKGLEVFRGPLDFASIVVIKAQRGFGPCDFLSIFMRNGVINGK